MSDYDTPKNLMIGLGLQDFFMSDAQGSWADDKDAHLETTPRPTTTTWQKPRDAKKDAETMRMIQESIARRSRTLPVLKNELKKPNPGTQVPGRFVSDLVVMVCYRLPQCTNKAGKVRTVRWLLWVPTFGCFVTIKDEHEGCPDFLNMTGKDPLSVRPGQWLRLLPCFLPKAPIHKVGICPCGNVYPFRTECAEC